MKNNRIFLTSVFMVVLSVILIFSALKLPNQGILRIIFYESILLFIAILSIFISWNINKKKPELLKIGNIGATGKGNRLFLIKDNHSWLKTGIISSITLTSVTAFFMISGMSYMNKTFSPLMLLSNLHWIFLFSIVNAFSEEVIYRIIPYEIMKNDRGVYPLISGLIFGIAHFWGNPGGPFGVIISGLLGYFLARSAIETKGSFWIILIHVLQDIAIFGVLFSFGLFV